MSFLSFLFHFYRDQEMLNLVLFDLLKEMV